MVSRNNKTNKFRSTPLKPHNVPHIDLRGVGLLSSKVRIDTQSIGSLSATECLNYLLARSRQNEDLTVDRRVFLLGDVGPLGDYRDPKIVAIGERLHTIGGTDLMRDVNSVIRFDCRARAATGGGTCLDYRELSICWHGVGDWLD